MGRGDDFLEVLLEEGFPREGPREGGSFPEGAGNTAHLAPGPWQDPHWSCTEGSRQHLSSTSPSPRPCSLPLCLWAVFLDLLLSHDKCVLGGWAFLSQFLPATAVFLSQHLPSGTCLIGSSAFPLSNASRHRLSPLTPVSAFSLSSHQFSSTLVQDPCLCQTLGRVLARQTQERHKRL